MPGFQQQQRRPLLQGQQQPERRRRCCWKKKEQRQEEHPPRRQRKRSTGWERQRGKALPRLLPQPLPLRHPLPAHNCATDPPLQRLQHCGPRADLTRDEVFQGKVKGQKRRTRKQKKRRRCLKALAYEKRKIHLEKVEKHNEKRNKKNVRSSSTFVNQQARIKFFESPPVGDCETKARERQGDVSEERQKSLAGRSK